MAPLASVVVVSWNGCHYLERCLAAVRRQSYPAVEVILVDNGSADGSADWVAAHFPEVRLIRNSNNCGFAAANNQGIMAAQGAYLATLNNDTQVEPQWLAALVSAMETDPKVGMVASKMLYVDRPNMINSAGICVDRCGIMWDRLTGQEDDAVELEPVIVFGPCAGAALYRRAMIDEVGLFNESYFAYLEDVDLAWRALWRGWKALYAPQARVLHVHSGTLQEGSPLKTYLLARNKLATLVRNYPGPYWAGWLPLIVLYEGLSLAFAVRNRRGRSAVSGRWDGLKALSEAWRDRQARAQGPHVSAQEVFARLEPAAWPWQVFARYRHLWPTVAGTGR